MNYGWCKTNFSSHLSKFSGLINNLINRSRLTGENVQNLLQCTRGGCHKNRAPRMHWAIELYVPFWTKGKGGRGLGFPRESSQFTGRRERASVIDKFFLGPQRQWVTEGSSTNRLCWIFSCLPHLVCIMMLRWCFSFKQVLCPLLQPPCPTAPTNLQATKGVTPGRAGACWTCTSTMTQDLVWLARGLLVVQ